MLDTEDSPLNSTHPSWLAQIASSAVTNSCHRWRSMPVVVAAISGWSGSGGFAVTTHHPVEAVVEGADVGVVVLLGTERGGRRAGRARHDGRGRGRSGRRRWGRLRGRTSISAARGQREQRTPCDRDARDTTHRSFLLLLRLLTRRFGGPERVCLSTTGSETPDGRHVRRAPSNDSERLPTGPSRPAAGEPGRVCAGKPGRIGAWRRRGARRRRRPQRRQWLRSRPMSKAGADCVMELVDRRSAPAAA